MPVITTFPTYPLRPTNGGRLESAAPKFGNWCLEPKLDGNRVMVHLPSQEIWNRHGEPFKASRKIARAVRQAREAFRGTVEWLDCEAIVNRHDVARGCLVVFDTIVEDILLEDRRKLLLDSGLPVASLDREPDPETAYLVPRFDWRDAETVWRKLRGIGGPLYEGVVAKRLGTKYRFQRSSPSKHFPQWMKHRFNG